ncbi:hypothetical protein AB0L33_15510 [Streptomyces sp. NPDC052299]|uniref:hypothetical protein n=1 Tax=Streptomyces sp. NPDC052299 TaxID=3155054 RepID=UPI00342BE158
MFRSRVLALPLVALAGAVFALAGCSSDDGGSGKDAPSDGAGKKGTASAPADDGKDDGDAGSEASGSGKGSAKLTYSGGASGEASIAEVTCAVLAGKLAAVNAPDNSGSSDPAKPSFSAVLSDGKAMTTLVTEDGKTYLATSAPGITSRESGGTWVVTVAGLKLQPAESQGDAITVDGDITCGSVAGV